MKERDLYPIIEEVLSNSLSQSALIEVKICKGHSLPFTALAPHQIRALKLCTHSLIFKIPDGTFSQSPADMFYLHEARGWVCIVFYVPHRKKCLYLIDINTWVDNIVKSDRKSVTEDDCKRLAELFLDLNKL